MTLDELKKQTKELEDFLNENDRTIPVDDQAFVMFKIALSQARILIDIREQLDRIEASMPKLVVTNFVPGWNAPSVTIPFIPTPLAPSTIPTGPIYDTPSPIYSGNTHGK